MIGLKELLNWEAMLDLEHLPELSNAERREIIAKKLKQKPVELLGLYEHRPGSATLVMTAHGTNTLLSYYGAQHFTKLGPLVSRQELDQGVALPAYSVEIVPYIE